LATSHWQDKILASRLNRGHKEALGRVYARYRVDMVTLASALLFDKDQAEDVVHEVFAKLTQNGSGIRITTNLRGYLLQAVANTARNDNRSARGKVLAKTDSGATNLRVVPNPAQQAMQAEYGEKLIAALQQLPYDQREVILLRHYGGMRFKAIAKCQGTSISTVQGRYRYGLDKLRSILAGDL